MHFTCEPIDQNGRTCVFVGINHSDFHLSVNGPNGSLPRNVQFKDCQLMNFPKEVFQVFSGLETLVLRACGVNGVTIEDFIIADKLIYLDLSKNQIKRLFKFTFRGAENLIHLNLSNNFIEYIDQETFYPLKQLEVIDLSSNRLRDFDLRLVSQQPMIILVNRNKLSNVTLSGKYNTSLSLAAEKNVITYLTILSFQVELLNLSKNSLRDTTFLCETQTFKNLKALYLSYNKIEEVYLGCLEKLTQIKVLDLTNNRLGLMSDDQIDRLKKIKGDDIETPDSIVKLSSNATCSTALSLSLFSWKVIAFVYSFYYIISGYY